MATFPRNVDYYIVISGCCFRSKISRVLCAHGWFSAPLYKNPGYTTVKSFTAILTESIYILGPVDCPGSVPIALSVLTTAILCIHFLNGLTGNSVWNPCTNLSIQTCPHRKNPLWSMCWFHKLCMLVCAITDSCMQLPSTSFINTTRVCS